MTDTRAVLAEHRFFADLSPRLLDAVAALAEPVDVPAGAWIARRGAPAARFIAVVSGRVGVEITAADRAPLIVATVHPGEVVGWSWFVEPHEWHFDVIALDDVHALSIDALALRAACAADHELGYQIVTRLTQVVASRLEATRHQLIDVYGRRD